MTVETSIAHASVGPGNIPETEKKNDGSGCTKQEKGRPRRRWLDNTWEGMNKY